MSNIKECFVSRFKNGSLVCADFSQLEIVVLAYLSSDKQLIDDITHGTDLHCVNCAAIHGVPYNTVLAGIRVGHPEWIKRRKDAKRASFALQYGAGARKIADMVGWDLPTTKKFINVYYRRYPGVKAWQDSMVAYAQKVRKINNDGRRTQLGFPAGVAMIPSNTGRIYGFVEYDDNYNNAGDTRFSRNELINYPIQGLAGGDLTMVVLGELYYDLYQTGLHNDIKLVNTVHDSIVLDASDGYVHRAALMLKTTMENGPEYLDKYFGINFNLPLKVEVTYGPDLYNQSVVEGLSL